MKWSEKGLLLESEMTFTVIYKKSNPIRNVQYGSKVQVFVSRCTIFLVSVIIYYLHIDLSLNFGISFLFLSSSVTHIFFSTPWIFCETYCTERRGDIKEVRSYEFLFWSFVIHFMNTLGEEKTWIHFIWTNAAPRIPFIGCFRICR